MGTIQLTVKFGGDVDDRVYRVSGATKHVLSRARKFAAITHPTCAAIELRRDGKQIITSPRTDGVLSVWVVT